MSTYTTIQGDTWDAISWKVYGDEKHMGTLAQANIKYIDTLMFSAGTKINVPELTPETAEDAPFWKNETTEDETGYYEVEGDEEDLTDEDQEEDEEEDE